MPRQDNLTTVNELKSLVGSFVNDRSWQSFHTPRNLASSISIEAAELLEIFQWDLEPATIDRTTALTTTMKVDRVHYTQKKHKM